MLRKLPLLGALVATLALSDHAAAAGSPQVSLKTSMGEIVVEVYPDKAPKTVENFLQYVNDGFYDGTIFHRVIGNFMVQGGGFTSDFYSKGPSSQKKTRNPVPIESQNGLKNDTGTIAMARTSDPNSATAQFFINVVDNASLNHPNPDGYGYAVFGKVVKGMDVVNAIRAVKTQRVGPFSDVPAEPVRIESATVIGGKR